jgi:hypothetical protein
LKPVNFMGGANFSINITEKTEKPNSQVPSPVKEPELCLPGLSTALLEFSNKKNQISEKPDRPETPKKTEKKAEPLKLETTIVQPRPARLDRPME